MTIYEMYPRYAEIESITNAQYAVVTFTEDHDFTDGEIVSFKVSNQYGMRGIDNMQARVLSHTSDTITVDVDTSFLAAFVIPARPQNLAIIVPVGSGIIPGPNPLNSINIEDAFDNRRV